MVELNLEDFKKWEPLFDYEGKLLDINLEYRITKHDTGDYSVDIRDLMRTDVLIEQNYRMFKTIEEVEEYLTNYADKAFELASYASQMGF